MIGKSPHGSRPSISRSVHLKSPQRTRNHWSMPLSDLFNPKLPACLLPIVAISHFQGFHSSQSVRLTGAENKQSSADRTLAMLPYSATHTESAAVTSTQALLMPLYCLDPLTSLLNGNTIWPSPSHEGVDSITLSFLQNMVPVSVFASSWSAPPLLQVALLSALMPPWWGDLWRAKTHLGPG